MDSAIKASERQTLKILLAWSPKRRFGMKYQSIRAGSARPFFTLNHTWQDGMVEATEKDRHDMVILLANSTEDMTPSAEESKRHSQ